MFFKIGLASIACLLAATYLSYSQAKDKINVEQPSSTSESGVEATSQTNNQQTEEFSETVVAQEIPVEPPPSGEDLLPPTSGSEIGPAGFRGNIPVTPAPSSFQSPPTTTKPLVNKKNGSYMALTPSGTSNKIGNPLYKLTIYDANGQEIVSFNTVSGRVHTQSLNRHKSGNHSPLPDGEYSVSLTIVPGTISEVGDRFLPIEPKFSTGRKYLGIHYDPSYEKSNGEDGTSGCIALKNRAELDQLFGYIRTYKPRLLVVDIQ